MANFFALGEYIRATVGCQYVSGPVDVRCYRSSAGRPKRLVSAESARPGVAGSDPGLTPLLCGRQDDTRLVGVEKPAVKEDAAHEPGRLEQTRREPYRNVVRNDVREQPGQP